MICEDDGAGVSAADKGRIFERRCGRNTGFGLYLAREILGITSMSFLVTGAPGAGARFEIVAPPSACRLPQSTVLSRPGIGPAELEPLSE